jgi:hypothetical protein
MSNTDFGRMTRAAQREQPPEEPREPPRWGWWLCGAGLVAVILIGASMLSPYARHQLALSLFRQSTQYTQLGFTNAPALPATGVRGKAINISFAITNDEGKQMSYDYVVSSGSGAKLESLASSSRTVASGATWDVNTTVVPKCTATACRVQVSLPQQDESIDFIYQDKSAAKTK